MSEEQRRAHLLMWIRALPDDVEGPAAMVKLLRYLLTDMDALREAVHAIGKGEGGR